MQPLQEYSKQLYLAHSFSTNLYLKQREEALAVAFETGGIHAGGVLVEDGHTVCADHVLDSSA